MNLLTILTPSYNRGKSLKRLYSSLLRQTCPDFEWLVVDDGSSDDTFEALMEMKKEKKIKITYIKKENGGKHTAVNKGLEDIETPLCMIVDSDDMLTEDAVKVIKTYWEKYRNQKGLCGFCFLKKYENGKIVVKIDQKELVDYYTHFRIRGNRPGDMAEVFFSEILKKYRFPEFSGEKFLSEDILWLEIGNHYQTVYTDIPIYICEYQKDGLTANDKPMKFASPKGSALRGKTLMRRECGIKVNLKGAIIYNCYRREITEELPDCLKLHRIYERILVGITKGLGGYYNKKWREKR